MLMTTLLYKLQSIVIGYKIGQQTIEQCHKLLPVSECADIFEWKNTDNSFHQINCKKLVKTTVTGEGIWGEQTCKNAFHPSSYVDIYTKNQKGSTQCARNRTRKKNIDVYLLCLFDVKLSTFTMNHHFVSAYYTLLLHFRMIYEILKKIINYLFVFFKK